MPAARARNLTTPDLVLLSLLAERAMHGYEANLELERRDARDWAAISRPQGYYSLEKLARGGLIRVAEDEEAAAGPERRRFAKTAKGRPTLDGTGGTGGRAGARRLDHAPRPPAFPYLDRALLAGAARCFRTTTTAPPQVSEGIAGVRGGSPQ